MYHGTSNLLWLLHSCTLAWSLVVCVGFVRVAWGAEVPWRAPLSAARDGRCEAGVVELSRGARVPRAVERQVKSRTRWRIVPSTRARAKTKHEEQETEACLSLKLRQ